MIFKVVGYMKKSISFLMLIVAWTNSLEILAGSSRAFFLRTPQFREAMRRQLSSSTKSTTPITLNTSKLPTSLVNRYQQTNSPSTFFSNRTASFFNNTSSTKWKIPSVIAATLVLFEAKHLLTSYSRENDITKAVEKLKSESWDKQPAESMNDIAEKFQHTKKGAEKLAEFKTLTKEVIPLYQTFKQDGAEKFIDAIVTKYNNPLGDAFRQSSAYRYMFKKLSPEKKEDLLSKIEIKKISRENELKELITEPGLLWGRRQKTAFSPDEKRAIFNLEREIKILNETTKTVTEQS